MKTAELQVLHGVTVAAIVLSGLFVAAFLVLHFFVADRLLCFGPLGSLRCLVTPASWGSSTRRWSCPRASHTRVQCLHHRLQHTRLDLHDAGQHQQRLADALQHGWNRMSRTSSS